MKNARRKGAIYYNEKRQELNRLIDKMCNDPEISCADHGKIISDAGKEVSAKFPELPRHDPRFDAEVLPRVKRKIIEVLVKKGGDNGR